MRYFTWVLNILHSTNIVASSIISSKQKKKWSLFDTFYFTIRLKMVSTGRRNVDDCIHAKYEYYT